MTKTCVSYVTNTMAAEDFVKQGAQEGDIALL